MGSLGQISIRQHRNLHHKRDRILRFPRPRKAGYLARFAQGTLVPTGSVTKINYVEDNGNGTTSAYEYIM